MILVLVVIVFMLDKRCFAIENAAMSTMGSIMSELNLATIQTWLGRAAQVALAMTSSLAVIGFVLSIKDLIIAGSITIESVLGLAIRYILLIGVAMWILQTNPYLIYDIPKSFARLGTIITGQSADISSLMDVQNSLLEPIIAVQAGLSWTQMGLSLALYLVRAALCILFFMMGATLLVAQVEVIFVAVAGMFTVSFIFIPFFKDVFLGFLKGIATAGLKCTLIAFLLQIVVHIVSGWPALIAGSADGEGLLVITLPMIAAETIMYMLLKAIPSIANQIMSGQPSMMNGYTFTQQAVGSMSHITNNPIMHTAHKTVDAARAFESAKNATLQTGGGNVGSALAGAGAALMVMAGINGSGGAEAEARTIQSRSRATPPNKMTAPEERGEV
jgi:hypothetical protein